MTLYPACGVYRPLWKFAEQTNSGSQTQPKTAATQAQPVTSTPVKPAGPQRQAPAQAQMLPRAPGQPPRPASAYLPQPQDAPPPGARRVPAESLIDKDRLSDFPESEASLISKQSRSELLDRVVNFCGLERGEQRTEEQKRFMGMKHPYYHNHLEPPLIWLFLGTVIWLFLGIVLQKR